MTGEMTERRREQVRAAGRRYYQRNKEKVNKANVERARRRAQERGWPVLTDEQKQRSREASLRYYHRKRAERLQQEHPQ
jgi:hypothetical protein